MIISLATGVARDMALGPYKGKGTGEPALLRALLDGLATDEIVLGDRYFGSFFMLKSLMHREVDGLFRMYQGRKFDFRRGRRLGVEDHLVTWAKPPRPEWMAEETYAQIPDEMTVRELRFKVEQPGFRVDNVVLVTTMLDATMYTKDELADLYLQRWNVELDLRAIKDVLQMDVLRCKSPEMVEKEIWMHLLAYNLIRGVMAQAAEANEKRPRQLSFKGTLQTITAFQEAMRRAAPADRELLLQAMLRAIAQQEVGDRFGRVEPRANKRRPKAQRYLTEPRPNVQTLAQGGITANLVPFVSEPAELEVVRAHSWKIALGLLAAATLVLALMSEILTDALEPATKQLGINDVFAGIILLASVSNISGIMNAVVFARKNQMDLAVSSVIGAATQIGFGSPALVLASLLLPRPMDLLFSRLELVALFIRS